MPFPSTEMVAGRYSVTWNALPLGIMEDTDAGLPSIEFEAQAQIIEGSDAYGKCQIEGFYQGERARSRMRCMEYKAGVLGALWPWASELGAIGVISQSMWDLAQPLVLTATAGTPAATKPATLTGGKAILAPGFASMLKFGPALRVIPLEFLLFLYQTGSAPVVNRLAILT